jgi:16S rRNA (cytosine1402-N4)-methyltransferase
MNFFDEHQTVLLQEATNALNIRHDGIYIDGTFGRGGHTQSILKCLGKKGRIIAIDKDKSAIAFGKKIFKDEKRIEFVNNSFTSIGQISKDRNLASNVDGILLDLGVSSPQIFDPDRGFSFQKDGPLDMRMNQQNGITAEQWLNTADEKDIARVIKFYGEDKSSKKIASAIVKFRNTEAFTSTLQLANLCKKILSSRKTDKHPATKVFQAIRIFINNELEELKKGLDYAFDILSLGGRLVVISFHSLEDRIVKHFMQNKSSDPIPSNIPITKDKLIVHAKIIGKKIKPSLSEIKFNRKSRSAIMRVLEKINDNNN